MSGVIQWASRASSLKWQPHNAVWPAPPTPSQSSTSLCAPTLSTAKPASNSLLAANRNALATPKVKWLVALASAWFLVRIGKVRIWASLWVVTTLRGLDHTWSIALLTTVGSLKLMLCAAAAILLLLVIAAAVTSATVISHLATVAAKKCFRCWGLWIRT